MRIGSETASALEFSSIVLEALGIQHTFQPGAGIDTGGRMGLQYHQVAAVIGRFFTKEMIKTHLDQGRGRGVGGDVAADTGAGILASQHHRHGVPAQDILQALFNLAIAGIGRLFGNMNSIQVGRIDRGCRVSDPLCVTPIRETGQ